MTQLTSLLTKITFTSKNTFLFVFVTNMWNKTTLLVIDKQIGNIKPKHNCILIVTLPLVILVTWKSFDFYKP